MDSVISKQPSPYSDGQVGLKPGELEIRLTAEDSRAIVEDVLVLRRATAISPTVAGKSQTPALDRLVNTLVVEYAALTGTTLVFEAERQARR